MLSQVSGSLSPQVLRLLGLSNDNGVSNNIAALASGSRASSSSVDVASMSAAARLQSEMVALKGAGQNIARQSSLLQVAQGGMEQAGGILERMGELAALSNNGALSEGGREGMNEEFQQLKEELDRISSSTEFDGNKLLNGSYNDDTLDGDFSIADISSKALFAKDYDILSGENAAEAYGAIKDAYATVNTERAAIGSYQARMDITSASIETAFENQDAARASLIDTDYLSESSDGVLNLMKYQGGIATQAQGNKLQGNLLSLLSAN